MFNRECPRCQGRGRYDRGTCFRCKGRRFIRQKSKPSPSLTRHVIEVKFSNGSRNIITMYGGSRDHAEAAVAEECRAKGWDFTITPALFTG